MSSSSTPGRGAPAAAPAPDGAAQCSACRALRARCARLEAQARGMGEYLPRVLAFVRRHVAPADEAAPAEGPCDATLSPQSRSLDASLVAAETVLRLQGRVIELQQQVNDLQARLSQREEAGR